MPPSPDALKINFYIFFAFTIDISVQKPAYFLVTQAKIHLYSAKRKEVFRMQNERENNQRNQKENQNQRENKNEQRNQKENRK